MKARRDLIKSAKSAKSPKIPEKYLSGLSGEKRAKRKRELERRARDASQRTYEPLPSDKGAKTKPSKYSRTKLAKDTREKMEGNSTKEFLSTVSKLTGIKRSILKKVHERGAAAWATGHRVGASQVAWSRARVYSFATGGKTQKTADKDLWKQHKEN
tara:strand:- start:3190 stop:3660 length:471 start_codon:yes stop_codon:yes gene_type:complete